MRVEITFYFTKYETEIYQFDIKIDFNENLRKL